MKRAGNIKQIFWSMGLAVLLFVFVFGSIGASAPVQVDTKSINSQVISRYKAAQANLALSDEEKIKVAIDAYFTLRYEGQKLLQVQDFALLLDDDTLAWVKKENGKREIELYRATLFHLNYVSYKYTLDYDSLEIKNNNAKVLLRESHEVVFEAVAPEISRLANLPHTLTLYNKQGVWVVYKDEYQDELSEHMDYVTKEDIKKQIDESYQENLKNKISTISLGNKVIARPALRNLSLNTYPYSGSAAAAYADQYVTSYNTAWYVSLSQDCTNFVSQAIYKGQGKTPPATSGMQAAPRNINTDWYYVFNNSGSTPWIQVQAQYNFITGNTNKIGPYGVLGTISNPHLGDVIQIKQSAIYDHEGIIVVLGTDLFSSLLDAHTTNRNHYPVSNWIGLSPRPIWIQGWRGN